MSKQCVRLACRLFSHDHNERTIDYESRQSWWRGDQGQTPPNDPQSLTSNPGYSGLGGIRPGVMTGVRERGARTPEHKRCAHAEVGP
jgi:hypothetical protein